MIQENLYNETEIRRFLLGELPAEARSALEERFIADEDLFEQIRAAEDDLIESYVRETLSPAEKTNFEREFLSTEARRSRVGFARSMLDALAVQNKTDRAKKTEAAAANISVLDKLKNFFSFPKLAFGAALALLILLFGSWIVLRNSNSTDLAGKITPTPRTVEPVQNQTLPPNRNTSVEPNTSQSPNGPVGKNDLPNADRPAPTPVPTIDKPKETSAAAVTPVLALFTGATRSGGKTSELALPKNAAGARLELHLESADYKIYAVEIVNPDGEPIFKSSKLKTQNSKINFFVPAQKLPTGDYIVRLSALNRQNENESVADYNFRVKRK